MGVNAVKNIVPNRCKEAGLGGRNLTNHSIRSYMITSLSDAGENIESIMSRSGHRSSKGVQCYLRGTLHNAINQQRALTTLGENNATKDSKSEIEQKHTVSHKISQEQPRNEAEVSPTFNITFHVSGGNSTFNMRGK